MMNAWVSSLSLSTHPASETAAVVGLYSSTQSPGEPPFDSTSLTMIAGGATTLTVTDPDLPPAVATISAVPAASPVTSPVWLTLAIDASVVDHVTVPSENGWPA